MELSRLRDTTRFSLYALCVFLDEFFIGMQIALRKMFAVFMHVWLKAASIRQ